MNQPSFLKKREWIKAGALIGTLGVLLLAVPALFADSYRDLSFGVEYPGIEVPQGEEVSIDVAFYNRGDTPETVNVWIDRKPEEWTARIKTYKFDVSGIHVPPESDKHLTFEAVPEDGIGPGEYTFRIAAQSRDGRFYRAEDVVVTVVEKSEGDADRSGISLSTAYPVLRGPSDSKFEFTLDVKNEMPEDETFNLFARAPDGWQVNFKPAYESKYISSLRIQAGQKKSVGVEVAPASKATEGEYPVDVQVNAGTEKAETELKVNITGTYELKLGTMSGLLSLETKQGKKANVSVYVKNTGTAEQTEVDFMSFKPENWEVEFNPEMIESIPPGELKQVEVTITPYEDALVGDYSVELRANGTEAEDSAEFRVTVKSSSAWGWIGIGIIIVVIGGLIVLFRLFGRR